MYCEIQIDSYHSTKADQSMKFTPAHDGGLTPQLDESGGDKPSKYEVLVRGFAFF